MYYPWTSPTGTQVSVPKWSFLCCWEFLRAGGFVVFLNHKWSTSRCNLCARGRRRPTPKGQRTEGKGIQWKPCPPAVVMSPQDPTAPLRKRLFHYTLKSSNDSLSYHSTGQPPSDTQTPRLSHPIPDSSTHMESCSHQERRNRRRQRKNVKHAGGSAAVLAGRGILAVQIQPCSGEWGWKGPKHPPGASRG